MAQVSPAQDPVEQAAAVRAMFDRLAPRYDAFNQILSAGIHRRWRAAAVAALDPVAGERHLDLCAGTLDLACAIVARAPGARVAAADFSLPMLAGGRGKAARAPGPIAAVAADALGLPFADRTFDGLAIAFGLRNLADAEAGLAEMRRVLRPGGRLVVLEFTTPPGRLFRALYLAYFHHVLPRIGALIVGEAGAPRYLPDSVARFPGVGPLAARVREAGFARVRWRRLTGGIAALHVGVRE